LKTPLITSLLLLLISLSSHAQNVGAVFGPVVNPGHQSFEYRLAYDPDAFGGESGYAHRVHYQASFNDDFMGRIILQSRKTLDASTDFDFVQGELFWQLAGSQDYQTGIRFDFRIRESGRPKQVGVNWMNQFVLSDGYTARFILLTAMQFDDNAADGIALGTRASVFKDFTVGQGQLQAGLEMYSSYGNTDDLKSLSEQSHTIGPFISQKIGRQGWSYFAGALFGLTDAAADAEFRLRLTKSF